MGIGDGGLMFLFQKVIYLKNILKNQDDKPLVAIKSLALLNLDEMWIDIDIDHILNICGLYMRSVMFWEVIRTKSPQLV